MTTEEIKKKPHRGKREGGGADLAGPCDRTVSVHLRLVPIVRVISTHRVWEPQVKKKKEHSEQTIEEEVLLNRYFAKKKVK